MVPPHDRFVKIKGLVTPAGWDERGNVIALAISAFNEDEYLIEKNRKGDQLYTFIRKEVEVRGIVDESGGKKRIKIKEYHIRSSV